MEKDTRPKDQKSAATDRMTADEAAALKWRGVPRNLQRNTSKPHNPSIETATTEAMRAKIERRLVAAERQRLGVSIAKVFSHNPMTRRACAEARRA